MIIRKNVFKNGLEFNKNFTRYSICEDLMMSYQIYKKYGKGSLKYFPDLKLRHFESPNSRMKKPILIKMEIIYRYIFWKNEIYDNNLSAFFCYFLSLFGSLLICLFIDLFIDKSLKNIVLMIKTYFYLLKNHKKIDKNETDYNKYILE